MLHFASVDRETMQSTVRLVGIAVLLLLAIFLFQRRLNDSSAVIPWLRAAVVDEADDSLNLGAKTMGEESEEDGVQSQGPAEPIVSVSVSSLSATGNHKLAQEESMSLAKTDNNKVIVMAKLEAEDTEWVADDLPE